MSFKEVKIPTWVTLALALFAYCVCYLSVNSLPGNGDLKGWWGWYDQGEYLRSARAFTEWDFFWKKHQYPPLYPVMGALFVKFVPTHPFFFFNVAAFLTFVFVFERVARQYVSQIEAFALVILGVLFNATVMDNFAIPWTTTGTALIYSFTIYQLMKRLDSAYRLKPLSRELRAAFAFSAVFSLEVICRPVDAGAAAIFYPAYLYSTFVKLREAKAPSVTRYLFLQCFVMGVGLCVGLGLFMLFNWTLSGRVLGGYLQSTASYSGYFPFDIPRRAFFLFFDSDTVFLAPRSSIADRFPWLVLSAAGLLLAVFKGNALLRVLAAVLVWQFFLYAAYGDLTPISMWRWLNVHYFKWMFPYLALFAWLAIRWTVRSLSWGAPGRAAGSVAALVLAVAIILSVKFRVATSPMEATMVSGYSQQIEFKPHGTRLDFLDIRGIKGSFDEVYGGGHVMVADGRLLKNGRDFRMLQAPWGARIQFNRTIHPSEMLLIPDERVQIQPVGFGVVGSSYRLGFGRPRWRLD
jgi:hypothetical protein